jgi:hypothetical protein
MSNIPIVSFNKGLVTPHIDARVDAESYQSACRVMDNFIARMYGSAERRPGTYYINDMRAADTPTTISGVTTCLLVPFVYSRDIAYVLEFTGYYIRIYYGDAVVDEIDSPYAEADLFDLQFKQLGDVIWITHEDYQQRMFSRDDATTFDLEIIEINNGPFLKRNDLATKDGKEMTIVASGLTITNATDTTYNASMNSNVAYKAFDVNTETFWASTAEGGEWISVQWVAGKTIKRMRIISRSLRYFKLQGSNNGSDWTNIEAATWSGSCQEWSTGGESHTEITAQYKLSTWADITFTNVTSYTYYRINIQGAWLVTRFNRVPYAYIYEVKLSESATGASDDDAVLTCSEDYFSEDHVGALFALTQPRVNSSVTVNLSATGTSSELLVENAWTLSIETGWIGTVQLERKIKEDTEWEPIRQWTAYATNRAIQISGFEDEDNAYYRINVSAYTSGTVSGELTCDEANHTGICRVIEYTDSTNVNAVIVKDFVSEETTTRWAEGAWSDIRGYPSSCTFIEDRCVYGGMKALAERGTLATVWLSGTGDYADFKVGTKGSDAFSVTIETTETLQWVEAMDNLMVGTTGGIFIIRSSRMDTVMVPNPPPISRQVSAYPCDRVRPVKAMKTMLYLSGRQLRELAYDRKSYALDEDMTALCEQITLSPIVNMALQTNPDTILWCVHEDGTSSAFVYDRENNIMAWAEMPLAQSGGGIDPKVKSFCVIPDLGSGDDIYTAVHRTILGKQVYDGAEEVLDGTEEVYDKLHVIYVEKFAKRFE